jgi:hypothetical protein
MKRSRRRHSQTKANVSYFLTDELALGLHRCLLRDFRNTFGKQFGQDAEKHLQAGIHEYRRYKFPGLMGTSPYFFKASVQIRDLLKKYRFKQDLYTDAELEDRTLDAYWSAQLDFAAVRLDSSIAFKVLQQARKIARRILGRKPPEDLYKLAEFGKKSSIGCLLADAYLDKKLSSLQAFTGSFETSKWFFSEAKEDKPMQKIIGRLRSKILKDPKKRFHNDIEFLILKAVPKTWQILRGITPLSLLGLFYSHAVGNAVTELLASAGINIRRLQGIHRKLVAMFSISRTHATGDLERASDSVLAEHCNRVLPRLWYKALRKCLTHQVRYKQNGEWKQGYSFSVLPMGNGATFPIETLIFYCVIKAIGELMEVDGLYSVYGDDLIYPSKLHPVIQRVFPLLGFSLNIEKSYAESHFRESCGADYYHGVDVRPYFFRGEAQRLTRTQYMSHLYKVYNGLCERWSPHEIRQTLYYLLIEMTRTGLEIARVPPSFPSTAGIKVETPTEVPLDASEFPFSKIHAKFLHGTGQFSFPLLKAVSKQRFVQFQLPYYWLALREQHDKVINWNDRIHSTTILSRLGFSEPVLTLQWRKVTAWKNVYRKGRICRKRLRVKRPFVQRKGHMTMRQGTGTVYDWS